MLNGGENGLVVENTVKKYSKDQYEADLRSGINDRLIRYADILLMYAECCLEADNDEVTAKEYIQKVRDRANKNTEAFNTTQADAGKSYLKGNTLPTVDDLLRHPPVVGEVKNSNGDEICKGMELNTVRRILKHEYSVELYWEGWRFFNLMRWYNNPNDPDPSGGTDQSDRYPGI